jgi:hypothetical protein
VEVRAEVVAGGLVAAVTVAESGLPRQQHSRHQEQAHDALHGLSFFGTHLLAV